jgi:excisionase family DNA binding protein
MSELQFMTIEEVSKLLNLKVSKLRRDIFMKSIPYYKFGALIRFKREELLNWVDGKLVSSTSLNSF